MSTDNTLQAQLTMHEAAAFVSLARSNGTTQKLLGQQAIRRMLVAAKVGATLAVPPLGDQHGAGVRLWLDGADMAELQAVAAKTGATPEQLAGGAILELLGQARSGARPMIKPLAKIPEEDRATTLRLYAMGNENKAEVWIDRLARLAREGFTPEVKAALAEVEAVDTITPRD